MKTGIIVLCRHDSRRLPGKILRTFQGRAVLGHIVDRIRLGASDRPLVVATSNDPTDDPIAEYCRRAGLECFRGSLDAVSKRFETCIEAHGWEFGVRINGDNLFLDPDALRSMLAIADTDQFDFITNVPGRTFPRGMSIEIVRYGFYVDTMREVTGGAQREHVTTWLYEKPDLGRRYVYENRICPEAANFQLALDTQEDVALAERIFARAGTNPARLGVREIYALATREELPSPWCGESGPLLIAEIGGNHEGDFAVAKHMAEKAIGSGADCVKFQIYRGQSLVSPVESPDRYAHFQRFELEPEQHIELAEMCHSARVQYLSSVWDMEMLEWIDPYLKFYKIGSGDLTAWPLLRQFAKRGKPILLSTGLATLDEVLQAVEQIQSVDARYERPEWLCLLQCTSMYPIPDADAQLRVMDALRERTRLAVGYSDHTVGSDAIRTAVGMGAEVIEFHFTDSRGGKTFRDHKLSLNADEVQTLKKDLEQIAAFRGDGIKVPQTSELEHGHDESFRRAVYTRRPIKKGESISEDDLVLLRPAHGTDARDTSLVSGARALQDIEAFRGIRPGVDYTPSGPS